MKILLIAPIPPPLNGQSLTAQVFIESLKDSCTIEVVDMSKSTHNDGGGGIKRIKEVFNILKDVYKKQNCADIINLHLSESIAGNIKDLLIYCLCRKNLSKMYIYSHGCSLKRWVFDRNPLLHKINKFFISRTAGLIVTGNSHISMFVGMVNNNKISIIPNFAEDYIFTDLHTIEKKFQKTDPLKIVYLSNLISGKGYHLVLDAFLALSHDSKNKIQIDFAGGFPSEQHKQDFLEKIINYKQIRYLGFVQGNEKKEVLHNAHILCFPSYLFEGQGICVLEGYASGCAVITTGKNGIGDVFTEGVHGYRIEEKSSLSIKDAFEKALNNKDELLNFAISNYNTAKNKYRTSIFSDSIKKRLFSY
jgi:glycosyltransferase involved in cell wall biosynthesis